MRSTVYYILREHQLDCVHCWHHVVTGVDCWQFALGHLDICTSIDLCLLIFGFKCGIWTAPSKETKMGKFVLVGWGSTFKLVIVSLSRWVREIWFGRQNGPIFFLFLVYLSRRLKCTIVIMRCPYSVRPSLTFHIFDFSYESAERNWTKLYRKLGLNVFYQVCVFRTDRTKRWPPWPLTGWNIIDLPSATTERY